MNSYVTTELKVPPYMGYKILSRPKGPRSYPQASGVPPIQGDKTDPVQISVMGLSLTYKLLRRPDYNYDQSNDLIASK